MKGTRERILSAAYDLFSVRGYNASLEEVAKVVGIRTPSIYTHFASKEELFLVVISREIDMFFNTYEADLASTLESSASEQIQRAFLSVIEYFKEKGRARFWRYIPLIVHDRLRNECKRLIRQRDKTQSYRLAQVFKKGVEKGEFRPTVSETSVYLWMAMIQGVLDGMLLYEGDDVYLEKYARKTWEAFWDGIKATPC